VQSTFGERMRWPKKVIPSSACSAESIHKQSWPGGGQMAPHCVNAPLDVDTRTPLAAVPEVFAGIHQQPHSHGGAGGANPRRVVDALRDRGIATDLALGWPLPVQVSVNHPNGREVTWDSDGRRGARTLGGTGQPAALDREPILRRPLSGR
jgi:hypothetical protein